MEKTKFNIITRYSRDESINNLLDSLYSQTYKNFKHIITYNSDNDLDFLKEITDEEITTLVKVPFYPWYENLWMYYQYHDIETNYTDKEWHIKSNLKLHLGDKPNLGELDNKFNKKVENIVRYEKNGYWCETIGRTVTNLCQHFPFNIYLKIAESYVKDGWILYLDDDDLFENETSLERLNKQILNTNEDTLQVFRFRNRDGEGLIPKDKYLHFMRTGHPIVHMEVIAGCFSFHSKYKGYTVWDEWRRGDVRTVKSLERFISNINYIDDVILKAGYREKIYETGLKK
jgi:hypothetical protein